MKSKLLLLSLVIALNSTILLAQTPKGFTMLVVQRSGGDGAIRETYEVKSDGSYKFSDLKRMKKGQLAGDELSAFTEAVNGVVWEELPARQVDLKADKFQYTVALLTDGKFYSRTFGDSVHADNAPLVTFKAAVAKLK